MSDDYVIVKQSKAVSILNILLLLFNFIVALGLTALIFSRETYVEISNQYFSLDKPLMDSNMLDMLLRKEVSVLIVIIVAWLVVKEKRIESIHRRLCMNFTVFIALTSYATSLLYMIYMPVLNAS